MGVTGSLSVSTWFAADAQVTTRRQRADGRNLLSEGIISRAVIDMLIPRNIINIIFEYIYIFPKICTEPQYLAAEMTKMTKMTKMTVL